MSNLFTHGHQQLLGVQSSGLSAAWRRAAEDAARQAAHASEAPAAAPGRIGYRVGGFCAAVVLVAALAGAMLESSPVVGSVQESAQG